MASKERLTSVLRRAGTKEVPQIQGVGMKDSHHCWNIYAQPLSGPWVILLKIPLPQSDTRMGSAWVTSSLLDQKTTHLDSVSTRQLLKGKGFPKGKSPGDWDDVPIPKNVGRNSEKPLQKKKKTNRCLLQILKERLEKHKDTLDLPAFLTRKQSQALRLGGWTIWEAWEMGSRERSYQMARYIGSHVT